MKFWQLLSVCDAAHQLELAGAKAGEVERWSEFADWCRREDELVRVQDRAKLDFDLPDDYVETVLGDLGRRFYVSPSERWLRGGRFEAGDREVTALEAYRLYGGEAVEEASEKGVSAVA